MSARRLPVRPDLDQLKNQSKDLLKAYRDGDREASAHFAEHHPDTPSARRAKLADAQLVLARIYGASSWTRMVQCCQLIDAIWDDDLETVRRLVTANRNLLTEDAGIGNRNWGPPMSYAANLGRDRIIRLLHDLGARDLQKAMGRAVLQSSSTRIASALTNRISRGLSFGTAFWINYPRVQPPKTGDARFTELLIARRADPNLRASIRMRRDVTELADACVAVTWPETPTADRIDREASGVPPKRRTAFAHREIIEQSCRFPANIDPRVTFLRRILPGRPV